MTRFAHRFSLSLFLLALSGAASAVGLGDLRGQPVLGQPMQLEVDIVGAEKQKIDAACFRIVPPNSSDDLPWLKKAVLGVRLGAQPVLEIRTNSPLREPILQVAIQLACGHEISRDYIVMASPPGAEPLPMPVAVPRLVEAVSPAERLIARPQPRVRPVPAPVVDAPPRLPVRRAQKRPVPGTMHDRLTLSDGGHEAVPLLRLATDLLQRGSEPKEAQRDILRLEFRMLMALHEQATNQMETAEKLRNMEGALGELQLRAAEFAKRVESDAAAPTASASATPLPAPSVPAPSAAELPARTLPKLPSPVADQASGLSEWTLYGVLLGAVFGLAGWLGWRQRRAGRPSGEDAGPHTPVPETIVDPLRDDESAEPGEMDLVFEPVAAGDSMAVDFDLHAEETPPASPVQPVGAPARGQDSMLSISATSLNEQFEANPVMELADIMLSFGRVKGAAQALQEYIDQNPKEALQPWIRLMDIYRMAGMRTEFESVATNLHQNFNVEIQSWDEAQLAESVQILGDTPVPVLRAGSLEDMPRLIDTIVTLWNSGDVAGYIHQLLRDNRGGQRLGFTLPVVEDLLFLLELKETTNRMEKSDE